LKAPVHLFKGLGLSELAKCNTDQLHESNLKHLVITSFHFQTEQECSDFMSTLSHVAPGLHTLEFNLSSSYGLGRISHWDPNALLQLKYIRHLAIVELSDRSIADQMFISSNFLKQLDTLEINSNCLSIENFETLVEKCSRSLLHLKIRWNKLTTDEVVVGVWRSINKLNQLEALSFANHRYTELQSVHEKHLLTLKDRLQELNYFFDSTPCDFPSIYKTTLSQFTKLRTICLECDNVEGLKAISYLPHILQHLTVHTSSFSDEILSLWVESGFTTNLLSFTLKDTNYRTITPSGIVHLAKVPTLESLELTSLQSDTKTEVIRNYSDYYGANYQYTQADIVPIAEFPYIVLEQQLLPYLPNLRRLSMCIAYKLTAEGKERLASLYPNLCITCDIRQNKDEIMELQ
jgi:hypothetical protein